MSSPSTREVVIRLDGKLDGVLSAQHGQDATLQDHERRIRALERYLWMGLGILSVATAAIDIYLANR